MGIAVRVAYDISKQVGAEARAAAARLVRKAALDIEAEAKSRAPVDTGNLKNSILFEQLSELSAQTSVGAEYGFDVEMGTRAHVILPKSKKFLSFLVGGKRVFARRVYHPGARPKPYFLPAYENAKTRFLAQMGRYFDGR